MRNVVFAIMGIGLCFAPAAFKPAQALDYKVFDNKDFRFTLRYPAHWYLKNNEATVNQDGTPEGYFLFVYGGRTILEGHYRSLGPQTFTDYVKKRLQTSVDVGEVSKVYLNKISFASGLLTSNTAFVGPCQDCEEGDFGVVGTTKLLGFGVVVDMSSLISKASVANKDINYRLVLEAQNSVQSY